MEIKIYKEENCTRITVDLDGLDHQICMGIRHGLGELAEISEIAEAINNLAEAVREK